MMCSKNQTNRITITLAILLLGSFIIAFFPVWKGLVKAWYNSEEYSHGFFIVPISLFILWQKKDTLAEITSQPSKWGLVLVISTLLIYLFTHFAEIKTLASLCMVLTLPGIILYLYGFRIIKECLFPLFLLLFMIPVPAQIYSALTVPLQLFVSKISVGIAQLLSIPVYREGNVIHMSDRILRVVQACSGLRSMISLLALSVIFGYFFLRSNLLRSILFVSGIPTAIIVNIFRVVLIILAFYYFNFDIAQGTAHTVFGMTIFFLALIIIAFLKGILSIWDKSTIKKS
jgi:exosortase